MSERQPIGTAPTDGTWVLLFGGKIEYGWDGKTKPDAVIALGLSVAGGVLIFLRSPTPVAQKVD